MTTTFCLVEPPAWMTDPAIGRLFDGLEADGGQAWFVGGCVRDALLGRLANDVDIATTLLPTQTMAALDRAGIDHRPTGIDHGTITALVAVGGDDGGRRPIEVTTLRRDVETDGRHAVVDFTTDWVRDAGRRDFTMNALFAHRTGAVLDAFGGADDALNGRVVFIGDPLCRIDEDALRILRFFRFFAWYGSGRPDPGAMDACRARRGAVGRLSGERVRAELLRLLAAADPLPAWRSMLACGVLAVLAADTAGDDDQSGDQQVGDQQAGERGATALETALRYGLTRLEGADSVFRLGLVLAPIAGGRIGAVASRLRLSREEQRRVGDVAAGLAAVTENAEIGRDRRPLRRLAVERGVDAALAALAFSWPPTAVGAESKVGTASAVPSDRADLADLVQVASSPPPFPLRGRDLVAAGLPPGPDVGRHLDEIRKWWLDRDCGPDRNACLAELIGRIETGSD